MNLGSIVLALFTSAAAIGAAASATAATTVQIGPSGKTFASGEPRCASDPDSSTLRPMVEAGLFNPKRGASAVVSLDGAFAADVTAAEPVATVWLAEGGHTVVVTLGRKSADRYAYTVAAGLCDVPDTSGNTVSADGTLEYAASGKSYATVQPGCAWNAATGRAQPYVHLFDNGGYLLDVSVNGVPLTQLSAFKPHVPVFLAAGINVIAVANAKLSTDYYVRDGGDGRCTLPQ